MTNLLNVDAEVDVAVVSRGGAPGAPVLVSFDDKLQIARAAVGTDSKRVAQVVRDMVESDG